MTPYRQQDLIEDWEFKILRSINGGFKTQAQLNKVLHEEAEAGWVLVEKFDNDRIRLKRSIRDRNKGIYSGIDPYRSYIGMTVNEFTNLVLGISLGVVALIFVVLFIISGR